VIEKPRNAPGADPPARGVQPEAGAPAQVIDLNAVVTHVGTMLDGSSANASRLVMSLKPRSGT